MRNPLERMSTPLLWVLIFLWCIWTASMIAQGHWTIGKMIGGMIYMYAGFWVGRNVHSRPKTRRPKPYVPVSYTKEEFLSAARARNELLEAEIDAGIADGPSEEDV